MNIKQKNKKLIFDNDVPKTKSFQLKLKEREKIRELGELAKRTDAYVIRALVRYALDDLYDRGMTTLSRTMFIHAYGAFKHNGESDQSDEPCGAGAMKIVGKTARAKALWRGCGGTDEMEEELKKRKTQ